MGQLYFKNKQTTNKLIEKRSDLRFSEAGGRGKREWDEGGQNVQISNYKINNFEGCNAQHDKYN